MNIKGGLFIAFGMLILAIGDNYIRFLTDKVGLWQFHLIRSLIAIPLLVLFSIYKNWLIILPKNFIWASHNQVVDLIKKNFLTIEARNLFASFNIDKIH